MVYTENGELVERSDMIEAHLLEILSGYDVGVGVNFLRFDRISGGTSRSILNINNSKSLYGRSLLLSLSYVDTSKGGDCSG